MEHGKDVRKGPQPRCVDVAVCTSHAGRRLYTYAVPATLPVEIGHAVFVPFGSDVLHGIVMREADSGGREDLRPIDALADPVPLLDAERVALALWMSEYYLAPLWECVAACLPPGYGNRPVTMVSAVDIPALLPPTPQEQRILAYVAARGQVQLDLLAERVKGTTEAELRSLQQRGYLTSTRGLTRPTARPRFEARVRLLLAADDARARAAEYREGSERSVAARVLDALAERPDLPRAVVSTVGSTVTRWLREFEEHGWIEQYQQQVYRMPDIAGAGALFNPPELSRAQEEAVARVNAGGRFLLHGVTGAGKTEVYLNAVEEALRRGQSAIVLVPEISLTPQAIRRFGERVGDTLAVMHSALGLGERFDQWHAIRRGEARVVLGSRSAIFAPAQNLGLIVVDEEHEPTYKQDSTPRYHTRTVAGQLCDLTGASLVLGSATPDVETYARSEWGALTRLELHERIYRSEWGESRTGSPPVISVVDMKEELREGNRSAFSRSLSDAIHRSLEDREQTLLFVNRRGTARFVLCRDCGYVASCPTCEIAYSLSRASEAAGRMVCHGCGGQKTVPHRCPQCDGGRLRPFGVGTERVEELARLAFPGARVARWDMDTARRKGAHAELLAQVEAHEVDILVGTQMIAKGLDLPAMRLVGVVDADVGLHLPDFRAHERAYQLLTQVAGRAGRRDRPGAVIIQSYTPEHPAIQWAASGDYRGFFEEELEHRRRSGYPPFARTARLTYASYDEEAGRRKAEELARTLRQMLRSDGDARTEVRGPAPAFTPRVRGRYRWTLTLRGDRIHRLAAVVADHQAWTVDIDPVSTG